MNIRILLSLVILSILVMGCRKDDISRTETEPFIPDPTITVNTAIEGLVMDESGSPLIGVAVQNENDNTTTDENGYFKFENQEILGSGGYLKFKQNGYFDNFKFITPNAGRVSYVEVVLVERDLIGTIPSSGGTVTTNGGARISLPANGMVDDAGRAYQGDVQVFAYWYNPMDKMLPQLMPGDLRGITTTDFVQLQTYGMMAVELESMDGEELNLADGSTASLEFPVSSDLGEAPAEIPLWYFDEQTGYWNEEGVANLNNGIYVAEVNHFSFWNCDAPFPLIKLTGRFLDQNGNVVPQAQICINVTTNGLSGYGWTDSEGYFCGKVPAGKTLAMQVKDNCGNIVYDVSPIGPFDDDNDLGDITITYDYGSRISGTLVCNGVPVSNGYVIVSSEFGYQVFNADENGKFSGTFINCGEAQIVVEGFDIENLTSSGEFPVILSADQDFSMGDLNVCEEDLDEYLSYTIKLDGNGDSTYVYNDISAGLENGVLRIDAIGFDSVGYFIWNTTDPVLGPQEVSSALFEWTYGQNDYDFNCPPGCGVLTYEITDINLPLAIGDYIEGTFILENYGAEMIDICGEFRVKLDDIEQFEGAIEGVVWSDENRNGIRENGETLLSDVELILVNGGGIQLGTTLTQADGSYKFENLQDGFYTVRVMREGRNATILLYGGDETIDNNFDSNDFNQGGSLIINENTHRNFDAGIAEGESIYVIGQVWSDINRDGLKDTGEAGLEGVTVDLSVGNEQSTTVTDGDGYYRFILDPTSGGDARIGFTAPDFELTNSPDLQANFQGFTAGTFFEINGPQQVDINCPLGQISTEPLECATSDFVYTLCGYPAEVSVVGLGGTPPYTYDWGFGPTPNDFIDIVVPGTYTVIVTDANGASCDVEFLVIESEVHFIVHRPSNPQCGFENGSLFAANAIGQDVDFYWEKDGVFFSNEPNLINLGPGVYSLTMEDLNTDCIIDFEFELFNEEATIGDLVWLDSGSTPNVQDPGDEGFAGLLVKLYDVDGIFIDSTRTSNVLPNGEIGKYSFSGDFNGQYYITVDLPNGYEFVDQSVGNNNEIDSDMDPEENRTRIFRIPECISDLNIDIGIKQ